MLGTGFVLPFTSEGKITQNKGRIKYFSLTLGYRPHKPILR
jgi:hypothetical protein